jgi:hypothetical protein
MLPVSVAANPILILVLYQMAPTPALVLKVIAFTVDPTQTLCVLPPPLELIEIVGVGFTVTFTESFAVQPLAPVAVTTYSVVTVGDAMTGVP